MRWWPLSGIGFVVSFVVAIVLFGSGAGQQPGEVLTYYADHGDRVRQIAGFYVLGGGVLCLVSFAAVLSRTLAAPLVLASGTLTGGLLLGADALWAATAVTVQHERDFVLDPSTHLIVEDAGFVFFVASMLAAIAFVVTAAVAILRTHSLPRTLGWLGFAVAAGLAAAWYYIPLFGFLAWVAAASVLLTRNSRELPDSPSGTIAG